MSKQPAFWDSSALVPLCVHESTSRQAHAQLRKFLPVVWWGSLVEVHSAMARLHRLGQLTDAEKQKALSQLDLLNRGCREILPGDHVRECADAGRQVEAVDETGTPRLEVSIAEPREPGVARRQLVRLLEEPERDYEGCERV